MFLESLIVINEELSQVAWETMNESSKRFYECSRRDQEDRRQPAEEYLPCRAMGQLCWDELHVHSLLGVGSFSDVFEVKINHPGFEDSCCYAVKCVNVGSMKNFERDFVPNSANLALEAAILSTLNHKNIITVHGSNSSTDPRANRGHFLVLELLEETLADRFDRQRKSSRKNMFFAPTSTHSILKRVQGCTIGICDAMAYLHEKSIILRDLKPANVGFDKNGVVKLFDFGLARHLNDCEIAVAGSLRYMAPETILGRGSDRNSDVYSYGILLYEIVTLSRPYNHLHEKSKFVEKVVHQRCRPSFRSPLPSRSLARLIKACWEADPQKRPPFSTVRTALDQVEKELCFARLHTSSPRISDIAQEENSRASSSWKKLSRAMSLPTDVFDCGVAEEMSTKNDLSSGVLVDDGSSTTSSIGTQRGPLFRSMERFYYRRSSSIRSESTVDSSSMTNSQKEPIASRYFSVLQKKPSKTRNATIGRQVSV